MAEGVALPGGTVAAGRAVHDDPDSPPPPSAQAPRGWTWNRNNRAWQPKIRGKILWTEDSDPAAETADINARAGIGPDPAAQRDPDPGWMRDEGQADGDDDKPLDPADVPQQVKDDIAGLAGLILAPLLAAFENIDPYCGGAARQALVPAVDAALPLICRSRKIVAYFTEDKADWLLWGKLALALSPVGQAVVQHHVLRTVEITTDSNGRTVFVRRERGAEGDHLQPDPQPEFPYAA